MALPTLPTAPPATLNVSVTSTNAAIILNEQTAAIYAMWQYQYQLREYLQELEERLTALENP